MMNEMNIKKMEELLANEEFAQKMTEAGSYENAYQLFVENGVDATYEEFTAYLDDCRKLMEEKGLISADGELSVEMLEAVSGGRWYHSLVCFAIAGVALYFGQAEAGVLMIIAGIAVWKKK